jgi:signal transduction histidine kinase
MERALSDREMRIRELLAATPDVIFRLNSEGAHLDMHVSHRQTLNLRFDPEEVVGKKAIDIFPLDFATLHEQYRLKAIDTQSVQIWDFIHPTLDEKTFIEARFIPTGHEEVIVFLRNHTDRIQANNEVLAAADRERMRIGHELHDGVGQLLTGVSLSIESLAHKLEAEESPQLAQCKDIGDLVQRAIDETRLVSSALSPNAAIRLGLKDALENLAEQVRMHWNVECSILSDRLDHRHHVDLESQLYRITQQSIGNAVTHGHATAIEVDYECKDGSVRLAITDNGRGIPRESDRREGTGLKSIRHRSFMIDGRVVIEPLPDHGGTQVVCSCPCQAIATGRA